MKFKDWLRRKLKKFLEIDIMEDNIISLNRKLNKQANEIVDLKIRCNQLPKITDAGMDIGIDRGNHRHWAVFCAQGNGTDYVKFVDLSTMDYRSIVEMAKRLEQNEKNYKEYSRVKIDAPVGMKDIFFYERSK